MTFESGILVKSVRFSTVNVHTRTSVMCIWALSNHFKASCTPALIPSISSVLCSLPNARREEHFWLIKVLNEISEWPRRLWVEWLLAWLCKSSLAINIHAQWFIIQIAEHREFTGMLILIQDISKCSTPAEKNQRLRLPNLMLWV